MIIDGWIVPEDLSITFANGKQNPVDVIAGSNKDEHTALGGNVAFRDTMMWAMRLFNERQTAIGKRAYWSILHARGADRAGCQGSQATHAAEIVYAFNNLWAPRVFPDSSSPKLAMASEKDRAMADQMSSYWVNFARTGDPERQGPADVGALQGSQRAAASSSVRRPSLRSRRAERLRREVRRGPQSGMSLERTCPPSQGRPFVNNPVISLAHPPAPT